MEKQTCGGESEILVEKMRNEGWRGAGGGEVKFYIIEMQMIQDELAEKGMEKPVNIRNVERSLLKRVVDDAMRLLVFLHPK